jgi:hypothetical protein
MKLKRPFTEPAEIVEYLAKGLAAHATAPLVLTDEQKAAILRALSSRGPRKGYLKAKSPSPLDDQLACAAWQGIQPNTYKLGIGSVMMLRDPEAQKFALTLSEYRFPAWLDYDRHALQQMGAW